jgi:hypothetical protein
MRNGGRNSLSMFSSTIGKSLVALAAIIAMLATSALAAEPRPWLCRDKPVFSSDQPMSYELTSSSRREWHLFLMTYSPASGHDGFNVVKVLDASRARAATGHLAAGRYFAVALYHNASGYWICPGHAADQTAGQLGMVSALCFSDSESGCPVRLTVKPDHTTAAPSPAP